MKKITTIEERKELKKEGIFLEGMFWAQYGNSKDVMVIMILLIATALMSFYQFHAEWMDDHTYVLMLLSLLCVVYPLCWAVSPMLFYHNEVNKMIKSKELYVYCNQKGLLQRYARRTNPYFAFQKQKRKMDHSIGSGK